MTRDVDLGNDRDVPLGGEGLMGMLGVAGLCVALVAMTTWALELFPARKPAVGA